MGMHPFLHVYSRKHTYYLEEAKPKHVHPSEVASATVYVCVVLSNGV